MKKLLLILVFNSQLSANTFDTALNKLFDSVTKTVRGSVVDRNTKKCEATLATVKSGEFNKAIDTMLLQAKINFLPKQSVIRLELVLIKCMCENVSKATTKEMFNACSGPIGDALLKEIGTFAGWVLYKKILGR